MPKDMQGIYEGYGVVFTRKTLYNKMFIDEIITTVGKIDEELGRIASAKIRHAELSWSQIYQRSFRRKMSRGAFFSRIAEIKRIGGKVRARIRQRYEDLGSSSFQMTLTGIGDIEVGRIHAC